MIHLLNAFPSQKTRGIKDCCTWNILIQKLMTRTTIYTHNYMFICKILVVIYFYFASELNFKWRTNTPTPNQLGKVAGQECI